MQPNCASLALHPHLDILNKDYNNHCSDLNDRENSDAGDDVDNLSLGNSRPSLLISARNRCAHLEIL